MKSTSKHFKTEQQVIDYCNEYDYRIAKIVSIVKDHTNGDFILFYLTT